MRGRDESQDSLFLYGCLEERIPGGHPLRPIRKMTEEALAAMDQDFAERYAPLGRPSIPPEQQLRALLVMVLFSMRSERRLMEELEYNLLYRWFVGLGSEDAVWDVTVFTKNRERFIDGEVARKFFYETVDQARARNLISEDHFTVDGTLMEAWASQKSFRPKEVEKPKGDGEDDPGNPTVNFRGEKRSNKTHQSTSDPDARLARKGNGQEAKLAYCGNVMTENRHGLVVEAELKMARGTAEREAAVEMIDRIEGIHQITVGADKAYDTKDCVRQLREKGGDAACSAKYEPSWRQRHRRAHDAAVRLCGQPAQTETGGRILRLAQDGSRPAQDKISRGWACRVGFHLCGCRLQSRAHAESFRCHGIRCQGLASSVSGRLKNGFQTLPGLPNLKLGSSRRLISHCLRRFSAPC